MRRSVILAIVGLACIANPVLGDAVYLMSYEDDLIRHTSSGTETFTLSDGMFGMYYDAPSGDVYVIGAETGGTSRKMYVIDNAVSGTPSLSQIAQVSQFYAAITRIGDLFYAFRNYELWAIDISDPDNPVETLVGSTGVIGPAGAAYDPDGDTLYMVSCNDTLYEIDPSTGAATPIGPLGINLISAGTEWFEGQLHIAVQNRTSGDYEVGTLDTATGAYSMVFPVGRSADYVATALAIVPVPAILPLDIKPGSCPNSFNPRSHGVLPVSILGTPAFDVSMIDASTLLLSRADGMGGSVSPNEGPPGPHWVYEDTGTPFEGELCDCHDMGGDGVIDLAVFFHSPAVAAELGLAAEGHGAEIELVLSGTLIDGGAFVASDCIRVVSHGVSNRPARRGPTFQSAQVNLRQLRR